MRKVNYFVLLVIFSFFAIAFADDKNKKEKEHENESHHNKKFFTVNIKSGTAPLLVNFDASKIREAKRFFWNFGNGETLTTTANKINYTFKKGGTFLVTLKYSEKHEKKIKPKSEKEKNEREDEKSDADEWKNGGSETIIVKELPKIPPEAYFTYFTNGTYIWTVLSKVKTQAEIKSAYYLFDNVDRVDLDSFYPNTPAGFDLKTLGVHSVKLIVEDINGLISSFTHEVTTSNDPWSLAPYPRIKLTQSNMNTVFVNMSESFNPNFDPHFNLGLRNFHLSMGDGNEFDINTDTFFTYTYASPGTYTVTLTLQNGNVTRSESKTITITDQNTPALNPVASFHSLVFDFASNVSFNAENSGTPNGEIISYEWDFGDGSIGYGGYVAHFYNPGTYLIKLTVTDSMGLRSSDTQQVIIRAPGDDLALSINCHDSGDLSLACEYFVLDKFNEINRILVRYGDNSEENLVNSFFPPYGMYWNNHVYKKGGTYNVELEVDTVRGYKRILTQTVNVNYMAPIADLSCETNNMLVNCYSFGSYDPMGSNLKYRFDWGDNTFDESLTPLYTHAYQSAGLYTVTVTVTNDYNLSSQAMTQVMPVLPPNMLPEIMRINCFNAGRPYTIGCVSNDAIDRDGSIVQYKYLFDDNTIEIHSENQVFYHQFPNGGTHTVTLIVTDNDGGEATLTQSFIAPENQAPIADIYCYKFYGRDYRCNGNAYDLDGQVVSYQWEVEGGTAIGPQLSHTFSTDGDFLIKLTVADNFGAVTSVSKTISIFNEYPLANFDCQISTGSFVTCFSTSSDPDGQIVSTEWQLDNGVVFRGDSFSYTFQDQLIHNITLVVTDDGGITTSLSKSVDVSKHTPKFDIAYTFSNNYLPKTVLFEVNNLSDADPNTVTYFWDFGDGQVSVEKSPGHAYQTEGYYKVLLRIKTPEGVEVEEVKYVNIKYESNIIVETNALTGEAPFYVHFDGSKSTDFKGSIQTYAWKYNGEVISTGSVLDKIFDSVGEHWITLEVTNSEGDVSSKEVLITATRPPIYLGGDIREEVFTEEEYSSQFDLVTAENIPRENVQISFENAPQGVFFDSAVNKIFWTPTSDQVGSHEFKVIASDGILSSFRIVKIDVLARSEILNVPIASTGQTIQINNLNSRLNGASIIFPPNSVPYSVKILENINGELGRFQVTSSVATNLPYHVIFPNEVNLNQGDGNSQNGSGGKNDYYNTKEYSGCFGVKVSSILQEFKPRFFYEQKFSLNNGKIKIYYDANETDPLYLKLVEEYNNSNLFIQKIRNENKNLKVYLKSSKDQKDWGYVYMYDPENIYINVMNLGYKHELIKSTIAHEYYHLKQGEFFGCNKRVDGGGKFSRFIESSANYFASSELDKEMSYYENQNLVRREYSIQKKIGDDKDADIGYIYRNILNENLTSYYDMNNYRSELFYEPTVSQEWGKPPHYFEFDFNKLATFLFNNFNQYDSIMDKNVVFNKLFNDYGKLNNLDYSQFLLAISRDIMTKSKTRIPDNNNFYDTLNLKHLKNLYYDNGAYLLHSGPLMREGNNLVSFENLILNSLNVDFSDSGLIKTKNFEYDNHFLNPSLGPFSTIFGKANLRNTDLGNKFQTLSLPFFIDIENTDLELQDLGIEISDSQKIGNNKAYVFKGVDSVANKKYFFVVPQLMKIGPGDLMLPLEFEYNQNDHTGELYITTVNKSEDFIIRPKIKPKFSIRPACKFYDRMKAPFRMDMPPMIKCGKGGCWSGDNVIMYAFCRDQARNVWDVGNCITPKIADPICHYSFDRPYVHDTRYSSMFLDSNLKNDYRWAVICRSTDFNVETSNKVEADLYPSPGYSFDNYGKVLCPSVGL